MSKTEFAWLGALTLVALAVRMFGLGHESIWYDEAASLVLAAAPESDLLQGAPGARDAGNPPGYFVLLRLWQRLWGSSSIESARALSAVTGALSVPAVWLLARACGLSGFVGLLASLLVAFSPPLVYLGQEARVFALFTTVATLLVVCVARIERGGGIGWWVGFAGLGALSVHLHYYGALVLATLGTYLALWALRNDRASLWKLAACAVVVVVGFLPILGLFRWQLQQGASRSNETWWQHLALLPLFDVAGRTLIWKEYGTRMTALADLAVVLLIFVPMIWLLLRHKPWPSLLVWWVVGLPVTAALVSLKVPMVHSHYLSGIIPALLLLFAVALDTGWRSGSRGLVAVPAGILLLVMGLSLVRMYVVSHKDDWRGVASRTLADAPELPVYTFPDIGADPYEYYRPTARAHRLPDDFADVTEKGDTTGARQRMLREPAGFWLVLYVPPDSEEEGVLAWLRREFRIEYDQGPGRVRLLRCRPQPTADAPG